jgi:hypothetical protein
MLDPQLFLELDVDHQGESELNATESAPLNQVEVRRFLRSR